MIKYIIFEDEPATLRRLQRKISALRPDWFCVSTADGIRSGTPLLEMEFDLIFSDIHLSDGHCFELLKKAHTQAPVIFTTAYDQYALKAFEFNSIHYLLKPVTEEDLIAAIQKFEQLPTSLAHTEMLKTAGGAAPHETLVSTVGNKTTILNIQDIAYIHYQDRITWVVLFDLKNYAVDHSLDRLTEYLPSDQFFRINRQAIVNKRAVRQFSKASSNRLNLEMKVDATVELTVSKESSKGFKTWVSS